ncbi:MAG: trypsin-like serine protease [Myxococcaceae bacterium]|nr:trypsin-like serine protease [Myxococcaceae bacterium]
MGLVLICQALLVLSQAITAGAASSTPAVVDLGGCSGALISNRRTVLTAAHCLGTLDGTVTFDLDGGRTPSRVAAVFAHPGYTAAGEPGDVAVLVLLDEAPEGVEPLPLVSAAPVSADVGATVRLVGYGSATRREGTARLAAVEPGVLVLAPAPANACRGDSGGPTLVTVDGRERIAGVISSGDEQCERFTRSSTVIEGDALLQSVAERTAPGTAGAGALCLFPGHCARGRCVGYCSEPCGSSSQCPASMSCRAGWCEYGGPPPGALGGACERSVDCRAGSCARSEAAVTVCAERCFPSNEVPCADGFTCSANLEAPGQYACFPAVKVATGGCSATGAGLPVIGLLLVLVRRGGQAARASGSGHRKPPPTRSPPGPKSKRCGEGTRRCAASAGRGRRRPGSSHAARCGTSRQTTPPSTCARATRGVGRARQRGSSHSRPFVGSIGWGSRPGTCRRWRAARRLRPRRVALGHAATAASGSRPARG